MIFALTLLAALGCGLVAGVFFAFSTFVMKALARLAARDGIAAMQSINLTVLNPWFLGVFFGTGAACVLALICAGLRWGQPGAVYLLAGSTLYLVGTLLVTMVCNVPRNQALARVEPAQGAGLWAEYLRSWTAWNHVRTAASLAAAAALFAGAAIYINVAEHPARMALDTHSAAMQWASSYRRATWMQAPLAIVSFLAGAAVWLLGGGLVWLIAALFIGAAVPITLIVIMPTNRQLLDARRDPGSAETLRLLERWGRLHGLRSVTSAIATLLMLQA